MTLASSLKSIALLLGFLIPLTVTAQTLPEGAAVNKDKCLGYELPYKKYPRATVDQIQTDLFQIYQHDPEWKTTASRSGRPLSDGFLGPITWFWMQRFCGQFALQDIIKELPPRLSAIASFSETHGADTTVLVSREFALWSKTNTTACKLNTHIILNSGSETQLLQLLRCYQDSLQPTPVAKPVVKPIVPAKNAHNLYVLRDEDLTKLVNSDALADAIKKLTNTSFVDEDSAVKALNKVFKDQNDDERNKQIEKILAKLKAVETYQLTDKVLESLATPDIGDALLVELNGLPKIPFTTEDSFKAVIDPAIKNAQVVENAQPAATPMSELAFTSQASAGQTSSRAIESTDNENITQKSQAIWVRILLASKQNNLRLTEADAQLITADIPNVPKEVIGLLESLKNMEYPTVELIDLAIKNRILKALNICKLDESNTEDSKSIKIEDIEINRLLDEIKKVNPSDINNFIESNKSSDGTPKISCNEKHVDALTKYYADRLKPVLEPMYSKAMPPYTGDPILWTGGKENCGCVRSQIQTIAYGIYPYWRWNIDKKEKPEAQIFDFSTFSRVAYFGLTARDDGTLAQINAADGVPTLLNTASKEFIGKVRSYGGKMDWIIEKEFKLDSSVNDEVVLNDFFYELRQHVRTLLTTPLEDSESRFRPLLSFGLAAQPTNGDGVTFYFKNYPKDDYAKKAFAHFFTGLKKELAEFDEKRNRFRAVKSHTYVNIMSTQAEFLNPEATFSRENLTRWILRPDYENVKDQENDQEKEKGKEKNKEKNKENTVKESDTNPEIQDHFKSLVILLLEDPYYNALDKVYAVTNSTTRAFIAPLMFTDYSGIEIKQNDLGLQKIDERVKRLSYIHESFGGGGFWPMTEYENNKDDKDYSEFNDYIGEKFSPGYVKKSLWNEYYCNHRWVFIAVMNFWLLLALTYVISVFYIYPYHCRKLPVYVRWLEHPLAVVTLLLPVIVLWAYLFVVYPPLRTINLPNLLVLIVLALVIWAAINAVQKLNEPKPARNSSQSKNPSMVPAKATYAPDPVDEIDEIDDTDVSDSNK